MKRKIICFISIFILVFSMTGCKDTTPVTPDDEKPKPSEKQEITITDLLDDSASKVEVGVKEKDKENKNEEWKQLVDSSKPLQVGESYTEDFTNTFFKSRLRPYTYYYGAKDIEPGGAFEIVQNNGKNAVKMITDGEQGGAFDYIEFTGMRYEEGALYDIEVTYTPQETNRLFKMGFGHDYFMDLNGASGVQKTQTAQFTSTTNVGYNTNLNTSIICMVAGGATSSSIIIDKIKLTRKITPPIIKNLEINGSLAVGNELTVAYQTVLCEGVQEKDSVIEWFISYDKKGNNKIMRLELLGKKTITVSSDMQGYYVGCMITPKSNAEGKSGIGKSYIKVKGCLGQLIETENYVFSNVGDKLISTFESDNKNNLYFEADSGVDSYVSNYEGKKIDNNSLFIQTYNEIKGGYLNGVKFAGDYRYKLTLDLKFIQKPSQFYVQFRAINSLGYAGDVKYQVPLAQLDIGKEYSINIPALKIKNVKDYRLQIFAVGAMQVVVDNISIQMLDKESGIDNLLTKGGKIKEDFDTVDILTNIDKFENDYITYQNDGIEGRSLSLNAFKAGGYTLYFNDLVKKLAPNSSYQIKFDYKIITNKKPANFYVGVRNTSGNQDNIKVDFNECQKDVVYTFTHTYVLPNKDDMILQIFNMGNDLSIILIDNLEIIYIK